MTEQTRTNRIAESRAREVRPITKWAPAELLPEVDEEPGYAFRWIRTSMMVKLMPRMYLQNSARAGSL